MANASTSLAKGGWTFTEDSHVRPIMNPKGGWKPRGDKPRWRKGCQLIHIQILASTFTHTLSGYPTETTDRLPGHCQGTGDLLGRNKRKDLWSRSSKGSYFIKKFKIGVVGTSLVAQWLRIHLPMQRTRVRSLVQEDPTCHGATKPMRHNYWAHVPQLLNPQALGPVCRNYWAHVPQLLNPQALGPVCRNFWAHTPQVLKPTHLEPMLRKKRSHRSEKPMQLNEE